MSSFPCPSCAGDTTVKDSRASPGGSIRRRRKCNACGHRVTTYECLSDDALKFMPALARFVEMAKAINLGAFGLLQEAERLNQHAVYTEEMKYGPRRNVTQTPQE